MTVRAIAQTASAPEPAAATLSPSTVDTQFSELLSGLDSNDPATILKQITSGGIDGLWKWELEQLKRKVAAQVIGEMDLSPQQIAQMPDQQRTDVEAKIMREVERRVKLLIAEKAKARGHHGPGALDASAMGALMDQAQRSADVAATES